MSGADAMNDNIEPQKSEVHDTTDDSATSPANTARNPSRQARNAQGPNDQTVKSAPDVPPASNYERGAADADIEHAQGHASPDELFPPGAHVKKDESDFGGPIDLTLEEDDQSEDASA